MNKAPQATESSDIDSYAILTATWILACNDDNPLMFYESIQERLNLPETFDIRGIIQRHGELFRLGAPEYRLRDWKEQRRTGAQLPRFISKLKDEELIR